MTPEALAALIEADPQAKALAKRGDDEGCAARCREIAPKVQMPLGAQEAQRILSERKKWAGVRAAANSAQPQNTREACQTLLDWVTAKYDLLMAAPMETALFADLTTSGVLLKADVDALRAASMMPDPISARDVSEAMKPQRPGGKV